MELHQLRYFLAVVDTGSFTAAAAAVRVSQSGISTQVQKLERELGVALFDRTARRAALTADGERLLPVARDALAAVRRVRATADDLRGLIVGSLRVGTVSGLAWPPLFDALASLHAAHPGLDIRLHEGTSEELIESVVRGESDVAVAAWTTAPPEGLETRVVFDDALVAVVSADHPWASRRSIRPSELRDADLVALAEGTGARAALDRLLSAHGGPKRPRWEVSTPAFVEMLAVRGLGVGIVSETTCAGWREVRTLRIDAPDARSRLGIAWRGSPGHAARALLAALPPVDG